MTRQGRDVAVVKGRWIASLRRFAARHGGRCRLNQIRSAQKRDNFRNADLLFDANSDREEVVRGAHGVWHTG